MVSCAPGSNGDACVWELEMVPDTRKTNFSRWVGLLVHSGAAWLLTCRHMRGAALPRVSLYCGVLVTELFTHDELLLLLLACLLC